MKDQIVQLVIFSGKWIAITQNRSLDIIDCVMLTLDCTWSKVMVLCDLASCHIKLTLELFWQARQFWCSCEEHLCGVVGLCQWVQHKPSSACSDVRMRGLHQRIQTGFRSLWPICCQLPVPSRWDVRFSWYTCLQCTAARVACRAHLILSMANNIFRSASPASRWSARSAFRCRHEEMDRIHSV